MKNFQTTADTNILSPTDTSVGEENTHAVAKANNNTIKGKASLKDQFLLVKTQYMAYLNQKSTGHISDLNTRSDQINYLRNLLQAINLEAGSSGAFDCSANTELMTFLQEASGMGVKIDLTKTSYTKEETDALKSNINMTMASLVTKNDLLMQTIQQYIQEGNLAQQFAKDNIKTLHDMMISIAQKLRT